MSAWVTSDTTRWRRALTGSVRKSMAVTRNPPRARGFVNARPRAPSAVQATRPGRLCGHPDARFGRAAESHTAWGRQNIEQRLAVISARRSPTCKPTERIARSRSPDLPPANRAACAPAVSGRRGPVLSHRGDGPLGCLSIAVPSGSRIPRLHDLHAVDAGFDGGERKERGASREQFASPDDFVQRPVQGLGELREVILQARKLAGSTPLFLGGTILYQISVGALGILLATFAGTMGQFGLLVLP